LIGHAADYTTLKSSSGVGGVCSSIYRFQTSSVTLPPVATQYPRTHICCPQYRFRSRAYPRHPLIITLLKLFDLAVVVAAFGLAAVIIVHEQHSTTLAQFFAIRTRVAHFGILVLALSVARHCRHHAC